MKRFFDCGKQNENKKKSPNHYKGLGMGGPNDISHEGFFHLLDYINNKYYIVEDPDNAITIDEWLWHYTHPFSSDYPGPGWSNKLK